MASIADELMKTAKRSLSEKRFAHVVRVTHLASQLAERFGVNTEAVRIASAAHDLDREERSGRLYAQCADRGIHLTASERRVPGFVHGPVTAARLTDGDLALPEGLAHKKEIAFAVRNHTLGEAGTHPILHVLYIADYCEPGRGFAVLEQSRDVFAAASLGDALCRCVEAGWRHHGKGEAATERMYQHMAGRR